MKSLSQRFSSQELTPQQNAILDFILITLGCAIYAVAVIMFIRPLQIPLGGVAGLALIFDHLFSFPVGIGTFVLNLPLIFVGYKMLGRKFISRTTYAIVVNAVLIDTFALFLPRFEGDRLLAALYGGVLMGTGLGIIFARGGTTGGSDIVSKVISTRTGRPIGKLNLMINAVVVLAGAIIYSVDMESLMEGLLYAIIVQFLSSTMIDRILTGVDSSNAAFIITDKPEEIASAIFKGMDRGVTSLSGEGMFTHHRHTILLCAAKKQEVIQLKRIIMSTDPRAFIIMMSAQEIIGNRWKTFVPPSNKPKA